IFPVAGIVARVPARRATGIRRYRVPGPWSAMTDRDPRPVHPRPRPKAPAPGKRNPLHFVVVILLLADIVLGLGLAVFAEKVISYRPMAVMGLGLAALGLGILAYFVLFGA